jgi:exopolyphosphatase / guanosine-5'-triphosphate,3'-diphosphate pyrophosphatase
MKASIDIGSNSVLLVIGEFQSGKFFENLDLSHVTGLGKGIDKTKEFAKESMDKTFQVLSEYQEKLKAFKILTREVMVTATEASRVAQNSREFFKKVEKELGFIVQIINPEGEAFFSAKGVDLGNISGPPSKNILVDLGGASTEIIKFSNKPFHFGGFISLPIGSVRATEWIEEKVFEKKFKDLIQNHQGVLREFETEEIIGMAGSITALAAMMLELPKYSDKKVHDKIFEIEFFQDFVRKLEKMDKPKIKKEYPVVGERLSTIFGGAKVALEIFRTLKVKKIFVSTFGLRHGLLTVDKIDRKYLAMGS